MEARGWSESCKNFDAKPKAAPLVRVRKFFTRSLNLDNYDIDVLVFNSRYIIQLSVGYCHLWSYFCDQISTNSFQSWLGRRFCSCDVRKIEQYTTFKVKYANDINRYTLVHNGTFFFPYYFLFGSLGLFHLAYGFLKACDLFLGTRIHRKVTESTLFYFFITLGTYQIQICVNNR